MVKKIILIVMFAANAAHAQTYDLDTQHPVASWTVNNIAGLCPNSTAPSQSNFSSLNAALEHAGIEDTCHASIATPVTHHDFQYRTPPTFGGYPSGVTQDSQYGNYYMQIPLSGGEYTALKNSDNTLSSFAANGAIVYAVCTDSKNYNNIVTYRSRSAPMPVCLCVTGLSWDPQLNACVNRVFEGQGVVAGKRGGNDPAAGGSTCKSDQYTSVPGDTYTRRPIHVNSGSKVFFKGLGFTVGRDEVGLRYNSANRFQPGVDKNYRRPTGFGELWSLTLNRSMNVQTSAGKNSIQMIRDDGSHSSFRQAGSTISNLDVSDPATLTVQVINGSATNTYWFKDAAGNVETYLRSGGIGTLNRVNYAGGGFIDLTWSTLGTRPILLSVQDDTGRKFYFRRGVLGGLDENRIVRIEDAAGLALVQITYNSNGDIVSVAPAAGESVSYLYELQAEGQTGLITGVLDGAGNRFLTVSYNTNGVPTSTVLAGGVEQYIVNTIANSVPATTRTYDEATNTLTETTNPVQASGPMAVTYPNGVTVNMQTAYINGRNVVTSRSQPSGSGCAASTSTLAYDAAGNLIQEDDFTGGRTCYAYDTQNRLTDKVEGLGANLMCEDVLSATKVPLGARKATLRYTGRLRTPTQKVESRALVTNVSHGQPDPFNNNAVANCTAAPLLPDGSVPRALCKQVVQSTFDTRGDGAPEYVDSKWIGVVSLVHADPATGLKNMKTGAAINVGGYAGMNTSTFRYGGGSMYTNAASSNDYLSDYNPPGITSAFVSDTTLEASIRSSIANQSEVAVASRGYVYGYNRDFVVMLTVSYVDGKLSWIGARARNYVSPGVDSFGFGAGIPEFDAAVRPAYSFDDIAMTKVGNTYSFFVNGKKVGSTTRVNALVLPDSSIPDGSLFIGFGNTSNCCANSNRFSGYIDELRLTLVSRYTKDYTPETGAFKDTGSTIDSAVPPAIAQFTYDGFGRLLTATDTLGRTTSYSYYAATAFTGVAPNEVGATQGDLQSISKPGGYVTSFDAYDRAGRVLKSTDPKGVVTDISYTPRGWVSTVTSTAPGQAARTTSYGYDNAGQLTSVSTPDGQTLSYSYDAAHRLIGVSDAKGNSVSYTLDNMGNRINEEVKDPQGNLQRAISRSFDALNRLQTSTGAAQ